MNKILQRLTGFQVRGTALAVGFALDALFAPAGSALAAAPYLGPTAYRGTNNSPFHATSFAWFHLENFEGSPFGHPGATFSPGWTILGGGADSVDEDDGAIDGSSGNGHSLINGFRNDIYSLTITFDAGVLPTHAGLVWTDVGRPGDSQGYGHVTFEAFDAEGHSLGTHGPFLVGDGTGAPQVDEDRFFGVTNAAGISSMTMSMNSTDWEVDHIQYGLAGPPVATTLNGTVVRLDSLGRAQGTLAGATVQLSGVGSTTSGAQGTFQFNPVAPGTRSVTVSKAGYYSVSRTLSFQAGVSKFETFQLTEQSGAGVPSAYDFSSPNGKHFISGMPGNLTFSTTVVWNGSPGTVRFLIAGTWHPASITDLGGGLAQATLSVPAPATIGSCSEWTIEVTNGQAQTRLVNAKAFFHPVPAIIPSWYRADIPWLTKGQTLTYDEEFSVTLWDAEIPSGVLSSSASVGYHKGLSFDPQAGAFVGTLGGFGNFSETLKFADVENLGEGRIDLSGALNIGLQDCQNADITPGWEISLSGKAGVRAPAVLVVDVVLPPLSPTVHYLMGVPGVKHVLSALKLRLSLLGGLGLAGEYGNLQSGNCYLGSTALSLSGTIGAEVEASLEAYDAAVGVYGGGTGTPEFQICPSLQFQGLTLRAHVGIFAEAGLFEYSQEVGAEIQLGPSTPAHLVNVASLAGNLPVGKWQPVGNRYLRWGEPNQPVHPSPAGRQKRDLRSEASAMTIVTNVTRNGAPSLMASNAETLVLFPLHDAVKPWYAATDIGTMRQLGTNAWSLNRIVSDLQAEFTPQVASVTSNIALAAWVRVAGDISTATGPQDVAPHFEIVAAWFDGNSGNWTSPAQLTTNAIVDRAPLPVVFGRTQGILWIQNAGNSTFGDSTNGDRLVFSQWLGAGWSAPQMLWSAPKGIAGFAFTADAASEGRVVFAVDEDGNPDTRTDRELYRLSTAGGVWQAAVRLTSDGVEDSLPTLVAPSGVPMCIWSVSNTVTYSSLNAWNPRSVFSEYTLANQAPTLDGVTMPGGAAVAYAVQGSNGVDMVAAFYDAALDRWSLPRQLTEDDDVESALALACDGTNMVVAYLKTQTLRTNVDVVIGGQTNHLESVPQPGRTDLCLLRYALGADLAAVPGSLILSPTNPAPGSNATLSVMIENRGDRPVQNVQVVFYEGDPANSGVQIGSTQTVVGPLVGGAKQSVSVVWAVPMYPSAHTVYAVMDPALVFADADRSNNTISRRTTLPDLKIETCWNTEVSATVVALVARVVNAGTSPSGPCEISWQLGSPGGEELGRSGVGPLWAGQVQEVPFLLTTSARYFASPFATVFAVVDGGGVVSELDEANNAYPQSVRVTPAWVPRIVGVRVLTNGNVLLTVEATGAAATNLVVESAGTLASPIPWGEEVSVVIATNTVGDFVAEMPAQGGMRFYRMRLR